MKKSKILILIGVVLYAVYNVHFFITGLDKGHEVGASLFATIGMLSLIIPFLRAVFKKNDGNSGD